MVTERGPDGEMVTRNRSYFNKLPDSLPRSTQELATEYEGVDDEPLSTSKLGLEPAWTHAGPEAPDNSRPEVPCVTTPKKYPMRARKKPPCLCDFVN